MFTLSVLYTYGVATHTFDDIDSAEMWRQSLMLDHAFVVATILPAGQVERLFT